MGNLFTNNAPQAVNAFKLRAQQAIKAATIFYAGKVKEALSVPAPRVLVKPKLGAPYYRATTPATPGAPPRLLSGALRRSIAWETLNGGMKGRVGSNLICAGVHERGKHPFLMPTARRVETEVRAILRRAFRGV